MPMTLGTIPFTPGKDFHGDFLLIAGPCVIENLDLCLTIAGTVKELAAKLKLPYVFKASFDKANRSSVKSYRGLGMDEGLAILETVKKQIGVPVTTDVHESDQCTPVSHVADLLQIPAFLCRQTDLLIAAGETGKPVSIKKGQFMAPWEMANAVEKVLATGNQNVLLMERGTFFGYNRLVNDFTGIPQMQALGAPSPTQSSVLSPQSSHIPVLMDATHSTQLPGGLGHATAGQRQYVGLLARAAVAAGCDGLFVEVHPTPEKSASDAATILDIQELPRLLDQCLAIRAALR